MLSSALVYRILVSIFFVHCRHRHQGPKSLEISDLYGEEEDVTEDEVTEAEETTDTTETGAADLGSGEGTSVGRLGQDAVM